MINVEEKKAAVRDVSKQEQEPRPRQTSSLPQEKGKDLVEELVLKKDNEKQRKDGDGEEEDVDVEEFESHHDEDVKTVVSEHIQKQLVEASRSPSIAEKVNQLDKEEASERLHKLSDLMEHIPATTAIETSVSMDVKSQQAVLPNKQVSEDKLISAKTYSGPEQSVPPKEGKLEEKSSTVDVVLKEEEVSVSMDEEEEESRPYVIPAIAEHDYFAAPPSGPAPTVSHDSEDTDSAEESVNSYCREVWMEHSYSLPIAKQEDMGAEESPVLQDLPSDVSKSPKVKKTKKPELVQEEEMPMTEPIFKKGKAKKEKEREDKEVQEKKQRKTKKEKLVDITNKGVRELAQLFSEPVVPKAPVTFEMRNMREEGEVTPVYCHYSRMILHLKFVCTCRCLLSIIPLLNLF